MNHTRHGAPKSVQNLAAGLRNGRIVSGSRKAVGQILYGGNLAAGATITINGTVFTAVANGAAGNQFNVGGDLATTLGNIVTVLNASVVAAVAKATYSASANTTLVVTVDAPGTAGNAFTLAGSVGTVTAPAGGTDADKLDVEKEAVFGIVTAAGTAQALALKNGVEFGQRVTLYFLTKGAGANAVVSGVFVGGTALTFDTAGEFVDLMWTGAAWAPIVNSGGSIA